MQSFEMCVYCQLWLRKACICSQAFRARF